MPLNDITAGPWTFVIDADDALIVGPGEGGAVIAGVMMAEDHPYPTDAECRANGHLLAAAPDMLAALQGVLRVADRRTVEFDAASAAIAKATGQEAARAD